MLVPLQSFKRGPGRNAERFLYAGKPDLLTTLPGLELYLLHHFIPLDQEVCCPVSNLHGKLQRPSPRLPGLLASNQVHLMLPSQGENTVMCIFPWQFWDAPGQWRISSFDNWKSFCALWNYREWKQDSDWSREQQGPSLSENICWYFHTPPSAAAFSRWHCIFFNTKENATNYRDSGCAFVQGQEHPWSWDDRRDLSRWSPQSTSAFVGCRSLKTRELWSPSHLYIGKSRILKYFR